MLGGPPNPGGIVTPDPNGQELGLVRVTRAELETLLLNDPGQLISFAQSLGLGIGSLVESPTVLLQRLLSYADGFRDG